MPFFGPGGLVHGEQLILVPSGTRTANGSGVPAMAGDKTTARLTLDVTAASGTTPTMTVTVETSQDGSSSWTSVGSFAAATGVSSQRKTFAGLDNFLRATWTVGGTTPSFTFSVAGALL